MEVCVLLLINKFLNVTQYKNSPLRTRRYTEKKHSVILCALCGKKENHHEGHGFA